MRAHSCLQLYNLLERHPFSVVLALLYVICAILVLNGLFIRDHHFISFAAQKNNLLHPLYIVYFFQREIEIPCIPLHCLVFYNSSISFLSGTLWTIHRPSVLSHSGFPIGTFHNWKYHWLTRQCPSRGWGANMGSNLSPLDIHSHASFLLDFVLWKWQTLFSISK